MSVRLSFVMMNIPFAPSYPDIVRSCARKE